MTNGNGESNDIFPFLLLLWILERLGPWPTIIHGLIPCLKKFEFIIYWDLIMNFVGFFFRLDVELVYIIPLIWEN